MQGFLGTLQRQFDEAVSVVRAGQRIEIPLRRTFRDRIRHFRRGLASQTGMRQQGRMT